MSGTLNCWMKLGADMTRNEAAFFRFGTAFSNLEENSSERETILEMYPMKLSVVPPDKN